MDSVEMKSFIRHSLAQVASSFFNPLAISHGPTDALHRPIFSFVEKKKRKKEKMAMSEFSRGLSIRKRGQRR